MERRTALVGSEAAGQQRIGFELGERLRSRSRSAALAERLDYFDSHRKEVIAMAADCQRTVQPITWKNVVNVLLRRTSLNAVAPPRIKAKPKITVATTFPIYPPRGGGQSRVYHLYP